MKKKILFIIATIAMSLAVLTGCSTLGPDTPPAPPGGGGEDEKTGVELVEEMYGKLPDAKKIEQKIEIVTGTLLQYSSDKTFTKTGDKYEVKGKVKKLHTLEAGGTEAYTETSVDETLSAKEFAVTLDLDELYFTAVPEYKNNVLTGTVKDDCVGSVFSIKENFAKEATPKGMTLEIETDGTHVTAIEVTYTSHDATGQTSDSDVTITLKFTY